MLKARPDVLVDARGAYGPGALGGYESSEHPRLATSGPAARTSSWNRDLEDLVAKREVDLSSVRFFMNGQRLQAQVSAGSGMKLLSGAAFSI